MRPPSTADERERRFVEYIQSLHRGQLAEVKLVRLNRVANFRHRLMELLNELIETRAEDLAAGMMMEYAPARPKRPEPKKVLERLPLAERKRRTPVWIREQSIALTAESLKRR